MAEPATEVVLNKTHMEFFIKFVRLITENEKYRELRVNVRSEKTSIEVSFKNPEDYSVPAILRRIENLYSISTTARNEKLAEGAREEALSLIGLLIWKLNPR